MATLLISIHPVLHSWMLSNILYLKNLIHIINVKLVAVWVCFFSAAFCSPLLFFITSFLLLGLRIPVKKKFSINF